MHIFSSLGKYHINLNVGYHFIGHLPQPKEFIIIHIHRFPFHSAFFLVTNTSKFMNIMIGEQTNKALALSIRNSVPFGTR